MAANDPFSGDDVDDPAGSHEKRRARDAGHEYGNDRTDIRLASGSRRRRGRWSTPQLAELPEQNGGRDELEKARNPAVLGQREDGMRDEDKAEDRDTQV